MNAFPFLAAPKWLLEETGAESPFPHGHSTAGVSLALALVSLDLLSLLLEHLSFTPGHASLSLKQIPRHAQPNIIFSWSLPDMYSSFLNLLSWVWHNIIS